MRLRALTLDFCGTLAIESPARAAIYAQSACARGVSIAEEEMAGLMDAAHAGLPLEVGGHFRYSDGWFRLFIQRVFSDSLGLPAPELCTVEAELFARFSDPATFVLTPGARDLLVRVQGEGVRTALISNWGERLEPVLRGLGVRETLNVVLTSAVERLEKPDPRLFQRALDALGVPAADALHVGDNFEKDARGARATGMRCALIDRSGTMCAPDDVPTFADLAELDRHLRSESA